MKDRKKISINLESKTLLIAVSIAFIISLGFIYWQNFIYHQDSVTNTGNVPLYSPQVSTKYQVRYLTLDNWGVRVPLKESSYYYKSGDYTTINADDQIYVISTKSLGVACGTDRATIGSIEKVPASQDNKSKLSSPNVKATKVLDKYLYIFTEPNSSCGDSADSIRLQENATQEFIPLLSTIEPIK